jgi:hypothetical protein
MNYTYRYRNTITNKIKEKILVNINENRKLTSVIHYILLNRKRDSTFDRLFENYLGDKYDVESVREFLPDKYKIYADNLGLLRRNLVSMQYIRMKYKIIGIRKGSKCLGCFYNSPGQRDHMIYPYGCLL